MTSFDYGKKLPDGQHERHPSLPPESRQQFVRPVRTRYKHVGETGCGTSTQMGLALAETYAAQPTYYSKTFCSRCRDYFKVGPDGEFIWVEHDGRDGPRVGT